MSEIGLLLTSELSIFGSSVVDMANNIDDSSMLRQGGVCHASAETAYTQHPYAEHIRVHTCGASSRAGAEHMRS